MLESGVSWRRLEARNALFLLPVARPSEEPPSLCGVRAFLVPSEAVRRTLMSPSEITAQQHPQQEGRHAITGSRRTRFSIPIRKSNEILNDLVDHTFDHYEVVDERRISEEWQVKKY